MGVREYQKSSKVWELVLELFADTLTTEMPTWEFVFVQSFDTSRVFVCVCVCVCMCVCVCVQYINLLIHVYLLCLFSYEDI